jgi:hypothetical protein
MPTRLCFEVWVALQKIVKHFNIVEMAGPVQQQPLIKMERNTILNIILPGGIIWVEKSEIFADAVLMELENLLI